MTFSPVDLGLMTLIATVILGTAGHTLKAIELWLEHRDNDEKEDKEEPIQTHEIDIHIIGDQSAFVDGNVTGHVITGSHNQVT